MPKRTAVVIGTRPECIKLVPVIAALRRRPAHFDTVVCSAGQHREMLQQAFASFGLVPDVALDVMSSDQPLSELTALLLTSLTRALDEIAPGWIIVQGDTTTAFAAALAAYYQRRRIAHVEAGLRTLDRFNPFPEEMNRRLLASLADVHFAPTKGAAEALAAEGVPLEHIHCTGNTAVDAILQLKSELATKSGTRRLSAAVRGLTEQAGRLVVVTCHRRESIGEDLAAICRAVRRIAIAHPADRIVVIRHHNPQVRAQMVPMLGGVANLHMIEPLPYVDFVHLLAHAALVLTDSGGVQEEAPILGVPLLVLRRKTERAEGVEAGLAELVGPDEDKIVARASALLASAAMRKPSAGTDIYGDGRAADRIAEVLAALT
jgi:UDP-N-acetylglucosamine 2-epimerase (non-hydrolysing)